MGKRKLRERYEQSFPSTWRELEVFRTLLDSMMLTPIQRDAIAEQVQALVEAVARDLEGMSRQGFLNVLALIDAMLERAEYGRKTK